MAVIVNFNFIGSTAVNNFAFGIAPHDLVFSAAPAEDNDLVFGGSDSGTHATVDVNLAFNFPAVTFIATLRPSVGVALVATLPPVTFSGWVILTDLNTTFGVFPEFNLTSTIRVSQPVVFVGTLPKMTLDSVIEYQTHTDRPTVARLENNWQTAHSHQLGRSHDQQDTISNPLGWSTEFQRAEKLHGWVEHRLPMDLVVMELSRTNASVMADPMHYGPSWQTQDATKAHQNKGHPYQEATISSTYKFGRFQQGTKDSTTLSKQKYQNARKRLSYVHNDQSTATPRPFGWNDKFSNARVPRKGQYVPPIPPIPPGPEPCYNPLTASNLVFRFLLADQTNGLVYICDRAIPPVEPPPPPDQIRIPISRVYIVMNEIRLFKVDGNIELPVLSMSLDIDIDSWAWGFNASLPAEALGDVYSSVLNSPVELEAVVNGSRFRLIAEKLGRSHTFGKQGLTLSGRGHSALLAQPYSPYKNFSSADTFTAQQLMVNALTTNGVSIGWEIDWGIIDWSVPGGVWSANGGYMDAVTNIAKAAGAFVQPDRLLKKLFIKPKYPVLPWNWATTPAEIIIPPDVIEDESISWEERADYNAVYVTGANNGVLGFVKKIGSAGDLQAPMVTDPLITHADAARQRGSLILSETGKLATITLSMPILESTGIINPGKLVQYTVNGQTKKGITQKVSVSMGNQTKVRQNIEVLTHG